MLQVFSNQAVFRSMLKDVPDVCFSSGISKAVVLYQRS